MGRWSRCLHNQYRAGDDQKDQHEATEHCVVNAMEEMQANPRAPENGGEAPQVRDCDPRYDNIKLGEIDERRNLHE